MNYISRLFGLLVFLLSASALALTPPLPVLSNPESTQSEIKAISFANLPSQIAEDSAFVDQVIGRAQSVDTALVNQQELKRIQSELDKLKPRMAKPQLAQLQFAQLDTLDRYYQFIDQRLERWRVKVQANVQPLSDDAAQLALKRANWRETIKITTGLLSPALQNNVDALNLALAKAELAVSGPLSILLAQSEQGLSLHQNILQQQQIIRQYISRTDDLLWNLDSPNLLSALFAPQVAATVDARSANDSLALEFEFMRMTDDNSHGGNMALLVFSAILLPLLLWLTYQSRRIVEGGHAFVRYQRILARPFSAWVLLLVVMGVIENREGSFLLLHIYLLLAWIPVMRLQSRQMHLAVGRWQYVTLLFFSISVFGGVLASSALTARLASLLNATLMLATFAWLFYRQIQQPTGSKRVQFMARVMLFAGGFLMIVAVLANIFGNVYLATLLTQATLYSLYMGLFVLAARNVVRAYISLLVLRRAEKLRKRTLHAGRLFGVVQRIFDLSLVIVWALGVLGVFRALRPAQSLVLAIGNIGLEVGAISVTIGGIVLFCVSVYLSFWLAQTLRSILSEDILPSMTLPRGVANSVSTMSYYFLLMLGLMVALSVAGFQLSQLAMVLGALSVGIGFGLQTVVNNFVSGLILMIERPIQPGDTVELSGTTGSIREIGMRTTTLTTFDGADVVVPNGMLLSEKLTNWTLNNKRRRIEIPIGVSYDCDPKAVQQLLLEVVGQTAGISHDPTPSVLFMGFGESSLDFSVRAWTDNYDQSMTIRSEMALAIHAALKAAQIEIPFPQRDVHVRSVATPDQMPVSGTL